MPSRSRFAAPRSTTTPSSRTYPMEVVNDMRGLDMTSPYDLIEKGRAPYAKNFRLYAEDEDSRRIVVSSRKGAGKYVPPIDETLNVVNTSTTGAADKAIGVVLNNRAMPFTPSASGRLTRLELNIKKGTGNGPITVSIHANNSGTVGNMLAETTILPSSVISSYAYVPAKFVEAPLLVSSTQYWFFVHTQDDGVDGYQISSNTASTLSKISNAGIPGLASTTYSLNFKSYLSSDQHDKGMARFAQPFASNKTLVAYGTSMYLVDDVTGTTSVIKDGLNTLATNYYFSYGDGKVFWVNSYDYLTAWNGTTSSTNSNVVTNGTFESGVAGWTNTGTPTSSAVQDATQFHSGSKSMKLTASATRSADYAISLRKGKEYEISYWAKAASGTVNTTLPTATNLDTNTAVTMTNSWVQVTHKILPNAADTAFRIQATADIYIDDVTMKETGIEYILDPELPILSLFTFHKDRAWGIAVNDPNKLIFSENPGNPSDAADQYSQWYYAWLSVSFVYVPAPKASDAITGLVSFQDVLKIFTYTNKYDLYGSDRSNLTLRQSTGSKGAVSQGSILADENNIYFAANDGFYKHNGSSDELISDKVQSEFDGIAYPTNITVAKWKRQIRFYYGAKGSPYNTDCLLYHTTFEEWQHDTEVCVNRAVFFSDGDDDRRLVESSSLVPAIYNAEQDYNNLGKAIDFAYWMRYESNGGPAQKKRILKYFPLIQGVDRNFVVGFDMDKDFTDNPTKNKVILSSQGAVWGLFQWGDGTLWGSTAGFKPVKLRYPGYAYYWQPRIYRKGANNPVFFFGVQYSYKPKRL